MHLSFYPDAKIGVLGINGSGKSTLLKIMAGMDTEYQGEGFVAEGARVGYLPQEPPLDDMLERARQRHARREGQAGHPRPLQRTRDELFGRDRRRDDEAAGRDRGAGTSGISTARSNRRWTRSAARRTIGIRRQALGRRARRVALCKLLLEKPDLLLLDEPTNHLDAETVNWLEGHLRNYEGAILIVTHDRYFLDNVTGWILELDRGRGIPHEGNYTSYLKQKAKRLSLEKSEDSARQKQIEMEAEWMGSSPKARQAKSKARIQRYQDLVDKQASRVPSVTQIVIPVAERLGNNVVEFTGLSKAFGDKLLIDNLTFKLPPGGIVGVIGPNGAGKTTLFKMITGAEKPDKGDIQVGESVQLGYVDQSRDALDGKKNVWEEISERQRDHLSRQAGDQLARLYWRSFNFKGPDQQKKVGQLSGGERNRVHLAKMLKKGANLLLLDEPTNDLDVETLRALEDALTDYAGCAVIISHDRFFLDRIATHMLAFEGDSACGMVRGQFRRLRGRQEAAVGRERAHPASDEVQEVRAVTRRVIPGRRSRTRNRCACFGFVRR